VEVELCELEGEEPEEAEDLGDEPVLVDEPDEPDDEPDETEEEEPDEEEPPVVASGWPAVAKANLAMGGPGNVYDAPGL